MAWLLLLVLALGAVYAVASLRARRRRGLAPYPSPAAAEVEVDDLAESHPALCRIEKIGRSSEGRTLRALRLHAPDAEADPGRPRLLVTAHIHAVEYVGSYVARALLRRLVEGFGRDPEATALLTRADLVFVPLLNPDGAWRVWRQAGWSGLGGARFTATGVDPNRNFPFVSLPGRSKWNSGRDRPGSPYYRGPAPLSEPETLALARLARRERFCAAVNFHSFGGVVYLPGAGGCARTQAALDVFRGPFQSRQPRLRYRAVPERDAAIVGQLDAFLLGAFGTPSVTVEVSRPGPGILLPGRLPNPFWLANPPDPERWAGNDVDAALHALVELLERTGGRPGLPARPGLAQGIPDEDPAAGP